MLNKQKGNMYDFVSHTWNVIKGKCEHDCCYCYMKRFPQKDLWFDEKELNTNLGEDNFIFVGSSCDMFAQSIPSEWIIKILDYCKKFPENTYLFQSKNPQRFCELRDNLISMNCILGTTIETNREGFNYKAPTIAERIKGMEIKGFRKMVTIEPIMKFDLVPFVEMIRRINPESVNIGADSNKKTTYIIPEPSKEKLKEFIDSCRCFTRVKVKDNLKRIVGLSVNSEQKGEKDE